MTVFHTYWYETTDGGLRGLSSLLILKALVVEIKQKLTTKGVPFDELHPYHVFQLVAGTVTGGLIALMLGKMGMTVDDCIMQYVQCNLREKASQGHNDP